MVGDSLQHCVVFSRIAIIDYKSEEQNLSHFEKMYSLLLPSQLLRIQLKEQREAKKVKLQVKGISTQTLFVH